MKGGLGKKAARTFPNTNKRCLSRSIYGLLISEILSVRILSSNNEAHLCALRPVHRKLLLVDYATGDLFGWLSVARLHETGDSEVITETGCAAAAAATEVGWQLRARMLEGRDLLVLDRSSKCAELVGASGETI